MEHKIKKESFQYWWQYFYSHSLDSLYIFSIRWVDTSSAFLSLRSLASSCAIWKTTGFTLRFFIMQPFLVYTVLSQGSYGAGFSCTHTSSSKYLPSEEHFFHTLHMKYLWLFAFHYLLLRTLPSYSYCISMTSLVFIRVFS